jgi:DNA repair protein RadC
VYKPVTERTFLSDAPDAVIEQKRTKARQSCASTRAKYEWLDVDVCLTRRSPRKPNLPKLQGAKQTSEFIHEVYPVSHLSQEIFMVLCCNAKIQPIGLAIPHKGGLSGSMVELKTIFKPAILLPASGIIYAHNHPSGDPTPSDEDRDMTERLIEAGRLLGIKYFDHLILTEDPKVYYSFTEQGGR